MPLTGAGCVQKKKPGGGRDAVRWGLASQGASEREDGVPPSGIWRHRRDPETPRWLGVSTST